MYTQCPHCLTFFRINSAQLKAAAGKARCCQCNQIFNALKQLQERPAFLPDDAQDDVPDEGKAGLTDESLFTETLNLDAEQRIDDLLEDGPDSSLVNDTLDELFVEKNDGLEPEPDYFAAGSESQMSELLDRETSDLAALQDEAPPAADVIPLKSTQERNPVSAAADPAEASDEQHRTAAPEATPKAYPSLILGAAEDPQADAELIVQDTPLEEMFNKQPISSTTIAWGLGSLLLLTVLCFQIAWLKRDLVIHFDLGQQFLNQTCEILGCQAPQRRDISKIIIEHRDLRAHPHKPNALYLSLNMINRADFSQPYPKLQLSLFNDSGRLIARRTFQPDEYLGDNHLSQPLMPTSHVVDVVMELSDPGKNLTGFKFEFL